MHDFKTSRAKESLITAGAIALCFAFFLGLLHFSFPEGTSLRGLIEANPRVWADDHEGPGDAAGFGGRVKELARLTDVVRRVKNKPASAIAWEDAEVGLPLGDQHAVQTQQGSGATIEFGTGNSLHLEENSLVVLQRFDGEMDGSDRQATLLVFGGELRAQLAAGGGGGMKLRLRTPSGEARIESGRRGEEAVEVRVTVAEDSTSTVTVLEGNAEISIGEAVVEVAADEVVKLVPDGPPPVPRRLPGPPELTGPADAVEHTYRARAPRMDFRWEAAPDVESYRWVLARDEALLDVVLDEAVGGTEYVREGLDPGRYYWTVHGVSGDLESGSGAVRTFRLVRDDVAPELTVAWPDGEVSAKSFRLTGVTEPGAQVFVESVPAVAGEGGRFEFDLDLVPGANRVVVESVDAVGNSSYDSQIIKAQF